MNKDSDFETRFEMAGAPRKKATKRPVRTARQARSKATVDAIIEAATRILAETGWAALNTNAIAARAGVSVGSVYEYFPNKQAILDVIMDRHLEAGEALLAEAASEIRGPVAPDRVVEAWFPASFDFTVMTRACIAPCRAKCQSHLRRGPVLRRCVTEQSPWWRSHLVRIPKRGSLSLPFW